MPKAKTALEGQTPAERNQARAAQQGRKQAPSGKMSKLATKGGAVAENPNVR